MKPAPFAYTRAESAEHAVDLLADFGEDARVLAGGQSLVPMMALRLARPEALVDITRCSDLGRVVIARDNVTVGAAVTARAVERNVELASVHPLLVRALAEVGHPEIRARSTVCGSLAHADPAAEMPAVLLATNGTVTLAGPAGQREITAREFLDGPFMTTIAEGELIIEASFPIPSATGGWSIEEVSRRHGDFATVGIICLLDTDADGTCTHASLTVFGVSGQAVRASEAEVALIGTRLKESDIHAAAACVLNGVNVYGDLHGSVNYRQAVANVLTRRALVAAWAGINTLREQRGGAHD